MCSKCSVATSTLMSMKWILRAGDRLPLLLLQLLPLPKLLLPPLLLLLLSLKSLPISWYAMSSIRLSADLPDDDSKAKNKSSRTRLNSLLRSTEQRQRTASTTEHDVSVHHVKDVTENGPAAGRFKGKVHEQQDSTPLHSLLSSAEQRQPTASVTYRPATGHDEAMEGHGGVVVRPRAHKLLRVGGQLREKPLHTVFDRPAAQGSGIIVRHALRG